MLVYLRESEIEELLRGVDESSIPHHIAQRFQEEQINEEKIKNEKKNSHLYYNLNLICSFHLGDHPQLPKFDLIDLVPQNRSKNLFLNHFSQFDQMEIEKEEKLNNNNDNNEKEKEKEENNGKRDQIEIKIKKTAKFSELFERIEKIIGIKTENQRLWLWIQRQNGTYRPHALLPPLYSILHNCTFFFLFIFYQFLIIFIIFNNNSAIYYLLLL